MHKTRFQAGEVLAWSLSKSMEGNVCNARNTIYMRRPIVVDGGRKSARTLDLNRPSDSRRVAA